MRPTKLFSFKNAYTFAAKTFIATFFSILTIMVAWLGITYAAVLLVLVPLGALAYGFTSGLTADVSFITLYALLIGSYWIIFETMHFQFLRIAFSSYENQPITLSELFTFRNSQLKPFLFIMLLLFIILIPPMVTLFSVHFYEQLKTQETDVLVAEEERIEQQ